MAKVKGPLLSMEASGAFADKLIFTSGKQGQNVTFYHKPTGKPSSTQQSVRKSFTNAKDRWNLLSTAQKLEYKTRANLKSLTGYNLFLSEWVNYDDMILIAKDDTAYSTIVNVSAGGEALSNAQNLQIEVGEEIEVAFTLSNRNIVAGVNFGFGLKLNNLEVLRIAGTGSRFQMDAKRAAMWKVRIANKLVNGSYPIQAVGSSSSAWTLYQPALTLSLQHPVAADVLTSITVLAGNTNGSAIVDCVDFKIYKIN